jgi:hypothetical protein
MASLRPLVIVFTLVTATAYATTPPPFQRVLVPISVADVEGANGSLWTAELWAVNTNNEAVGVAALPCLLGEHGCASAFELAPGQTTKVTPLGNADYPGVLLQVPAHVANKVAFTLHVRDRNKQSESWGAEIPVVRDSGFFTGPAHLANVPFGSQYRQTLRLYALLDVVPSASFRVKMYEVTGARPDRLLREDVVTLNRPPEPPPNRIGTPLGQIALTNMFLIEIAGVDRVRISIEPVTDPAALHPPAPYWAFVSITNNKTQQVTTVTPR